MTLTAASNAAVEGIGERREGRGGEGRKFSPQFIPRTATGTTCKKETVNQINRLLPADHNDLLATPFDFL
jgi:hypothetical protein